MTAGRRCRLRGFTLLELLAVLLIIGLVAGLALPNFGLLEERKLRDQAERLAAELELARERSVMTQLRHQFVLDLDEGVYWIEWEVDRARESEDRPFLLAGGPRVAMEPPHAALRRFVPRPDHSGTPTALSDDVWFEGVELDTQLIDRGVFSLPFETDGSVIPVRILLGHSSGGGISLELLPLGDAIRIENASL